jgi:hypothetical protein
MSITPQYIPPIPPPPPVVPVTCGRIATNQFGDPMFLPEPLPGAPGNTGPGSHIWYSEGSSATGIHMGFEYFEELQGAAELIYSDSYASTIGGGQAAGALVPALVGDTVVAMIGLLDATVAGNALWNLGTEVAPWSTVTVGNLQVGVAVFNNVSGVGDPRVIVIPSGTPTQLFMKSFLIRGAAVAEPLATASGSGTAAVVALSPDTAYQFNLACLATNLAGTLHPPDLAQQLCYDEANGLQFSVMQLYNPTPPTQDMGATLSASTGWAMGGVSLPAGGGNPLSAFRQFIIMRDMVGTFQAGELLTAIEL